MAKIRRCEQEVFTTMYSLIFKEAARRGHLGVYALDSGLRGLVTKCVVFSGKTLDLHSLSPPPWVPRYSQGISTKCGDNPVIRGGRGNLWWTSIPWGVMHLKYSKGCNFRFVLDLHLNNRECIYIKKQKRNKRKFPWSKLVTFRLMPSYFFWEALTTLTQPRGRALYFFRHLAK